MRSRPNALGHIHLSGAAMLRSRLLCDIRGQFDARMTRARVDVE